MSSLRNRINTNLSILSLKIVSPPPSPISPTIRNLPSDADIVVDGINVKIEESDLVNLSELGRGSYGVVEKVKHAPTDTVVAVKRIRATENDIETKRLLTDLDVIRRSECNYIVKFYGAIFREGDVMIFMEMMDLSLDKFYKRAKEFNRLIPEALLRNIAFSVISALDYLQNKLNVIHRDVKPSNMLIDRKGNIKMCDFGISGYLKDSYAQTIDVGCRNYMAPERVDVLSARDPYDMRSDVWSFGISMIEISTGNYPYSSWDTPFDQEKQVVQEESPSLPDDSSFSSTYKDFIVKTLQKRVNERPQPSELLKESFLLDYQTLQEDVINFVIDILNNKQKAVEK